MFFVGDVHGEWKMLNRAIEKIGDDDIILLGDIDIGIFVQKGFHGSTKRMAYYPKEFPSNVKFIRGNHDNPEVSNKHPNCLGEYGVFEMGGHKIGYLAGGYSLDYMYRTEGVDWWRNEELPMAELYKALDLFEAEKPDVMISHEAPCSLVKTLFSGQDLYPSRTNQLLDAVLLSVKSINHWFCGHYHFTHDKFFCGVEFHILNRMEFRHFE
jgi:hypothetical protein